MSKESREAKLEEKGVSLWVLKLVVFLCGATLMSMEMAGVRILNVYFGSVIQVWGAIIGVFLGALSLGYFIGGILADRWPRFNVLGLIIFIASLFVFLIPLIADPFCEYLQDLRGMDLRLQALLGSITLYFIPSVAMGMVSPFAVRLAARGMGDIGRVAGRLYALSTMGSIFGTFLAAFVLVEFMGNRAIILSLGVVLLFCAILSLNTAGGRVKAGVVGLLLMAGSMLGSQLPDTIKLGGAEYKRIEEFDSVYHHMRILEGPSRYPDRDNLDARMLTFNRQIQGGIEITGPERDEKIFTTTGYTEMLHLGIPFRDVVPERVLVIGCGAGTGPMTLHQDYPGIKRIDVVDIDPAVFSVARKYFRFPENSPGGVITSNLQDGRIFIRQAEEKSYDYVIVDAYSAGGQIPFHLITREFMEEVKRILTPEGVMVLNIISSVSGKHSRLYQAVVKTLRPVYGEGVHVFPRSYRIEYPSNIIIVCTGNGRKIGRGELEYRCQGDLVKRDILLRYVLTMLEEVEEAEDAPMLTDDFCPVDSMVGS
ncbi:MAG: fused MFS/spermidine synthase [Planctomycetes bacterium]|nr:fused MFS/spermidine synthase [Planctomycetota bacterium]